MSLLKRVRTLAFKVEATAGTAESLAGSDAAINAYNIMIQPSIDVEMREASGSFDSLAGVPGARTGTATFSTDLAWDGTSTLPPWLVTLLSACGYVNSTGTITPRSEAPGSNVKTLTIGSYQNGMRKAIAGAVGTFVINAPAGRRITIDWTFTGKWIAPTDTAILSPTYPTDAAMRFASATATFNSVALTLENFTFTAGNTIKMREDAADASGYKCGIITGRAPRASCNPESVLVATQDRFGAWLASTEAELSVTFDGPTNSTIELSLNKAQIINNQEGEREGLVTDEIEFAANKNGSTKDQDVQLIFTPAS